MAETSSLPPESFTRDYGCTLAEWMRWLPHAGESGRLSLEGPSQARVDFEQGHLRLSWEVLPPRQIALLRMARLAVHFSFVDTPPQTRSRFLHRFDLATRRGGG